MLIVSGLILLSVLDMLSTLPYLRYRSFILGLLDLSSLYYPKLLAVAILLF